MATEPVQALIVYDDSKATSSATTDRDEAHQLARALQQEGISSRPQTYAAGNPNLDGYQWLILFYSSSSARTGRSGHLGRPEQLDVTDALQRVVERRMQGVLAVTNGLADTPAAWKSIRTYDIQDRSEDTTQRIVATMKSARLPYNSAQAKEKQRVSRSNLYAAVAVAATVTILGSLILSALLIKPAKPTLTSRQLTATAVVQHNATAVVQQTATILATAIPLSLNPGDSGVMQQAYIDLTTSTLPKSINGFNRAEDWQVTGKEITDHSCTLDEKAQSYHLLTKTKQAQYFPCLGKKTMFTNFALDVKMLLDKGDTGGVIFRSQGLTYYRLSITPKQPKGGLLELLRCDSDCENGPGTSLDKAQILDKTKVDFAKPVEITIMMQDNQTFIYINGIYQRAVTDPSEIPLDSGQIGFYASKQNEDTDVTFSSLKVWSIRTKQVH